MKKLIYYITDHGKGHATRSVAIIRELQKENLEIIVRNSNAVDFLKKSLPNIQIIDGKTDEGTVIQNDGVSIDVEKSLPHLTSWINKLPTFANKESNFLDKQNPDLVISDISALPILAAQKANLLSMTISNFSWLDVLDFIHENEKNQLRDFYNYAHLSIRLPLGTEMKHFHNLHNVGLVSRKSEISKKLVRENLGIKNDELFVILALGSSEKTDILNNSNKIRFITLNTTLDSNIPSQDLSNYIEAQNLVHSADLVICKCGYGFVSECISSGTPFLYIYDNNHKEQSSIVSELNKMNCGMQTSLETLKTLKIDKNLIDSIPIKKIPIETFQTISKIKEVLDN